jgi:hypothetical protein
MDPITDREFRSVPHEDKLYSRLVMNTNVRTAILERNKRLRNERPLQDLSFGRMALSIPELDYAHLVRKYPDLAAPDEGIKQRAWARFCASSESAPYKVR